MGVIDADSAVGVTRPLAVRRHTTFGVTILAVTRHVMMMLAVAIAGVTAQATLPRYHPCGSDVDAAARGRWRRSCGAARKSDCDLGDGRHGASKGAVLSGSGVGEVHKDEPSDRFAA
jgi:hypothetical protein